MTFGLSGQRWIMDWTTTSLCKRLIQWKCWNNMFDLYFILSSVFVSMECEHSGVRKTWSSMCACISCCIIIWITWVISLKLWILFLVCKSKKSSYPILRCNIISIQSAYTYKIKDLWATRIRHHNTFWQWNNIFHC